MLLYQTTIERPVSVEGVGLHNGARAKMTLRPAPADTGIVFVRTDLDDFPIPADWRFVARVSYATSLMRQGVLISTTEHILSALYAMGVDNALVEMDNLEAPILDGGGTPFVELLERAGRRTLGREREYIRVRQTVEVTDGPKRIRIEPAAAFELSVSAFFEHPLVGEQRLECRIEPEFYARQIAPARTFGFERDLDQMRDMGLIRGASLDNAVCFAEDRVLNQGGLRFEDEPCRHKALDLIGDLALLGRPLLGRVSAERAGHAMHIALVRKLMGDPDAYDVAPAERFAVAGNSR